MSRSVATNALIGAALIAVPAGIGLTFYHPAWLLLAAAALIFLIYCRLCGAP